MAERATQEDCAHAEAIAEREAMVAQRVERAKSVECPSCALLIPLVKMHRHVAEDCTNRLVPCKNAQLGCKTRVRPFNRAWHENADHLLNPRACLVENHGAPLFFVVVVEKKKQDAGEFSVCQAFFFSSSQKIEKVM